MLSTHIMQEVEAICDRVVIINKGEIVADDKAGELQLTGMLQTVYVEFEGEVSKSQLHKINRCRKIEKVGDGWLLEIKDNVDLRKVVAQFAQQNNILDLDIRKKRNH